jgi:hypothetical protein
MCYFYRPVRLVLLISVITFKAVSLNNCIILRHDNKPCPLVIMCLCVILVCYGHFGRVITLFVLLVRCYIVLKRAIEAF